MALPNIVHSVSGHLHNEKVVVFFSAKDIGYLESVALKSFTIVASWVKDSSKPSPFVALAFWTYHSLPE